MIKNGLKFAAFALLGLGLFAVLPAAAQAAPARRDGQNRQERQEWRKNHPRRAQVNRRLKNQDRRIRQGVRSRKLSKQQAQQLHQEDQSIRAQERQDAAANGGHITKQEQKQLNQEENQTSKQIYQEKTP